MRKSNSSKSKDDRNLFRIVVSLILIVISIVLILEVYKSYQIKENKKIIEQYTQQGNLIYGADDSAPPLRFVDENGEYKGVVVDYINQLALEMGTEITCKPYEWSDALNSLSSGETDICDMFINKERSEKYVFTDPIYTLRTVMAIKNGKNYKLSDINKMRIATQKDDYANYYMKLHYGGSELVYVHDVGEGLDLLVSGKVDGVIGDEPVVSYFAGKKNIQDKVTTINTDLYEEEVVLAVGKDKSDLLKPLNAAIKNVRRQGRLEKIQQKWFGISAPLIEKTGSEVFIKYFIICLLVIVFAVLFKFIENRALKVQVRRRTSELEQSRNELRLIFNEMPECVIVLNRNKKILNCNNSTIKLFGSNDSNIIGTECSSYLKDICGSCDECIVETCERTCKDQIIKRYSSSRNYEIRAFNIEAEGNLSENVMLTIKDVTLEDIRNVQLLQSSKMIAIGQLAAGMAHQIRNPLGIIRTHSFILRKSEELDDKGNKSLDYIDDNVKRASSIIDNVLNFSRISDSKFSEVNIKEFIQSIVNLQFDIINKNNITVDIQGKSDIIINTSVEALKHILLNIIQNAIDAVEDRSDGRIEINIYKFSEKILISCQDNGIGICREDINDLFNPFFTTKPIGKGTGLGLFIAYNEVQRLNGELKVESEEEKGAKFCVILPTHIEQGGDIND